MVVSNANYIQIIVDALKHEKLHMKAFKTADNEVQSINRLAENNEYVI